MTSSPASGYTEDRVRAELPSVLVKIGKTIHQGRMSGRLNSYCTVSVENQDFLHQWHFAWSTVAKSLNKQTPLRVE